jgi:hypothetical protein
MDFELIIGDLSQYIPDPPVQIGRYYPRYRVIAVDNWTGQESEAQMADILSHEFIHHLLHKIIGSFGVLLDNIRIREEELQIVREKGIEKAWDYLSPAAKFALRCAVLQGEDDTLGNGVI